MPTLDERDDTLIENRRQAYESRPATLPRVGEYVRMLDGTLQRFSYIWPDGAQTSHGGSWYLGNGGSSFSGSLNPIVPFERLRLTNGRKGARFWVFHHDQWTAHNGVDFTIPVRIWEEVAS